MKAEEFKRYLNFLDTKKEKDIQRIKEDYEDSLRLIRESYIKTFPINAGDTIKVGLKTLIVRSVTFIKHSCVKTPLPVINTETTYYGIKEIAQHNGKPFDYKEWVVEYNEDSQNY